MTSSKTTLVLASCLLLFAFSSLHAQSPGVLYTWNGTGNVRDWFKNFGTNNVTIANTTAGELTMTETGVLPIVPGSGVAISDGFNTISESAPAGCCGGIDLTGLDTLEFDMGHNGVAGVNAQFFVQASPGSNYVALGPDVIIAPGIATYSLPLSGLSGAQQAFIRTIGMNIRDHVGDGNLTWTLQELRSAGTPLTNRDYATHDAGSSDNGLQGAIVNFDNAAVQGNNGGQNQTGLAHNVSASPPGNSGSLRWTDLAGAGGAAVSYANGTVFLGNTFNERPTDMSNYKFIRVTMAATNQGGNVASLGVQYFVQTGTSFTYQALGADQSFPADGTFHDVTFPLAGLANLGLVMQHGVNLRNHPDGDLIIDIGNILAFVPEPSSGALLALGSLLGLWTRWRKQPSRAA